MLRGFVYLTTAPPTFTPEVGFCTFIFLPFSVRSSWKSNDLIDTIHNLYEKCHSLNMISLTKKGLFNYRIHQKKYLDQKMRFVIKYVMWLSISCVLIFGRFNLLLLEPGEIYFEDYSVTYFPKGTVKADKEKRYM